jgi:hypothetical protein
MIASIQGPPNDTPLGNPPLPTPKKLDIKDNMKAMHISAKATQTLSRVTGIQRWYNAPHSKGRVYCVYSPPWEHFYKRDIMGATWPTLSISRDVLDREDFMSAAIHSL